MRTVCRWDRRGFTLAELARLVSEAHTVRLAAFDFLGDNGRFPYAGGMGTPPAEMEPYLPENYSFTFNDVSFYWLSIAFPNANNTFGTRNLGILLIDYNVRQDLSLPMRAHQGTDAYWTTTTFYYLIPG